MTESLNFQSIILKLQEFWAARGCLIWQPYYTQVGAGTMNPATFLRVLGPEPWNVAYVEPSIRPDDGRYGENPNRFQQHYQFQVILKPDPGNPVELYIQSLEALGIDPRQHDIRLVEDNWEQPAISAWGLGWEVWLDGQEITQFTYFQQVGGQSLDPVAVEITYGLERILIALRDAPAIWNEPWNETITYGEVRSQDEFEHSKYYFEIGDVDRLRKMYELFEAEANLCLEQGLLVSAHDYVLKCSHTFNILDTRGAVGVTERQSYFGRMRTMARKVAEAYVLQRQKLEYPLLKAGSESTKQVVNSPTLAKVPQGPQDFLLEIGVEELPAGDLDHAIRQLSNQVPDLLSALRLEYGTIHVCGTPRRLVVTISDLFDRQKDLSEEIKGPPAERAYDSLGKPTKAAEGFARGKGLDVKDLLVKETDGGAYVFATFQLEGLPTVEVLQENLPGLLAGIKFEKSMRWLPGTSTENEVVSFSRPIRWLVAMLGDTAIPFQYANVVAGNKSRGLRPYGSPQIEITSASSYPSIMKDNSIVLEAKERQSIIESKASELADSVGGKVLLDGDLLAEIANLVETPFPLIGKFPEEHLILPRDVLISVMKKHQRYIPVEKNGKLLPYFIIVRNGDAQGLELVRSGNEHVVRARFADANFFVREDQKHTLEEFRNELSMLSFHKSLGSMLDKSDRIEKLASTLSGMIGLNKTLTDHAVRAAHLSKADLASRMVVEMTSLQGMIGAEYAKRDNEAPEVVLAIAEQYKTSPSNIPAVVVALADRLDSLTGLFASGLLPSATKDPFALRRAAIGVVQPLIDHKISFDLRKAIRSALDIQPVAGEGETDKKVLEFIAGRMRVIFLDMGFRHDVIDAVLAEQSHDPFNSLQAITQLTAIVAKDEWNLILNAYARCARLTRDQQKIFVLNEEHIQEPAEKKLLETLQNADSAISTLKETRSVDEWLGVFNPMRDLVNDFFDQVMVMVDDQIIRENRLALLQKISSSTDDVVDLSYLEGF